MLSRYAIFLNILNRALRFLSILREILVETNIELETNYIEDNYLLQECYNVLKSGLT